MVKVWAGTQNERNFASLEARPGGELIERDPAASASTGVGKVLKVMEAKDFLEAEAFEVAVVWMFPLLNERLHLIHKLGIKVDPLKELLFDRPLRPEYRTFIDILASHGTLSDWGFEQR